MAKCPDCDSHLDGTGVCVICGYRLRRSTPRPPPTLHHPPSAEQVARAHELVAGLVARFALDAGRPAPYGVPLTTWAKVRAHAERFQARGLGEHAAWRLAEALVADPHHCAHCEVCGDG